MSLVSRWSIVSAPPFLCCAASYQVRLYGLTAFLTPLVPAFAAALKVPQFSVEALKGAVGPTPDVPALKLPPVPCGIAQQFAQLVPNCAVVPSLLGEPSNCFGRLWNGAPADSVPGIEEA